MSNHVNQQSWAPNRLVNSGSMNRGWFLQVLIVITTVATIVVNALANIVPFNHQTTGEISNRYPIYFVPAGYVFAIWSVIYLGLIAYSVYQARSDRGRTSGFYAMGLWHLLGSAANITWIFLWHWNQLGLSVLVIFVLLIAQIGLYGQMNQAGWENGAATPGEFWSIFIPFSIYLGWASVATIANISTWLYAIGWAGAGIDPIIWTLLLLMIAGGLGGYFGFWRRNWAYALVVVWAFVGIAVKQSAVIPVAYTSGTLAIVVALLALLGLRKSVTTL